jgi:TRAP-type C4-dicarboxylate transport system permease small subunit
MDAGKTRVEPLWLDPEILANFIDELREAGYRIGLSQYMAVQDVVLSLVSEGKLQDTPEHLRTLLGPILCSSAKEQEDFQYRFDNWVDRFRFRANAQIVEKPDAKARALSRELKRVERRYRQLISSLLIAVVLAVLLIFIYAEFEIVSRDPVVYDILEPISAPTVTPTPTPAPTVTSTPAPAPTVFPPPIESPPKRSFWQAWWFVIGLPLLTVCVGFLFLQFWWRRRAQLFLRRLGTTQQPELHKIFIKSFEHNLFPSASLVQASQKMRKRTYVSSSDLDVDRTINETLSQGGWIAPVYGFRQVLPEYLFLIDRSSFHDHQAKYADEAINYLVQNGVFVTVYHFDDNPYVCFPSSSTGSPQKLSEIAAKYRQYRLVIVADIEKLFNPATGDLEAWVGQTMVWKEKAILSPVPLEGSLNQKFEPTQEFIIQPLTPQGLQALGFAFAQDAAIAAHWYDNHMLMPESLRVRPYRWIERNPPPDEQIDLVLDGLSLYLGSAGFYWLSACAIFPVLRWNITVYLGNVLSNAQGRALVNTCSLIDLAVLPWFRYGFMPDWLRDRLIATLSPFQEKAIRTALQELLITAVQGSVMKQQLLVAKQHHSYLPRLANPILRILSGRADDDSSLRDYIFLSFMTGQPKLAIRASDDFARLFKKSKPKPESIDRKDSGLLTRRNLIIGGCAVSALSIAVLASQLGKSLLSESSGKLETKELTIGFISFPIIPVEDYEEVADYLKKQLGEDIDYRLDPVNFGTITQDADLQTRGEMSLQLVRVVEGKISSRTWDVAFTLSPIYSLTAEEAGYKFIAVMNPQARALKSAFFVRKDNDEINNFDDFTNRTIALGSLDDPLTSPYTFYVPLYHLYGLSLAEIALQTPQEIFKSVENGEEVDIGVGLDQVVTGEAFWLPTEVGQYYKNLFKIITPRNRQADIPLAGVFLSPELSEQDQERIAEVLLAAPDEIKEKGRYGEGEKPDYQSFKEIIDFVQVILICSDWRSQPARIYCK